MLKYTPFSLTMGDLLMYLFSNLEKGLPDSFS